MIAFRIGKRRTAWEGHYDVDQIIAAEFSTVTGEPDFHPSVYVVERSQCLQARAEHVASLAPPVAQGRVDLDLSGLAPQRRCDGTTWFALTRDCHAEKIVESLEALRKLVDAVAMSASRRMTFTREQVLEYMLGRLDAGDSEWISHIKRQPQWDSELAKARKRLR